MLHIFIKRALNWNLISNIDKRVRFFFQIRKMADLTKEQKCAGGLERIIA